MTPAVMRIVLLVSLAHAMVHVYEQALPSVEKVIAADLAISPAASGMLGTAFRIPFGVAALAAGWLTDRFGSRRMLIVYLLGCATMALAAGAVRQLESLAVVMFLMGLFASIYHPAGLAMIAHQTSPHDRGRALGWHGIFGSAGIAVAPLLASVLFGLTAIDWRQFYLVLAVPGVALALWLRAALPDDHPRAIQHNRGDKPPIDPTSDRWNWNSFLLLIGSGALAGFLYAAFTHFLARYLDEAGLRPEQFSPASFRTLLAGIVLACGAVGQGVAGRLAVPRRLNGLLAVILLCNAPCLWWMSVATGPSRLAATCLLALVHFMHQPVYNSLIPRYVSRRQLSTGYGLSNLMTFGVGALGPSFAGWVQQLAPAERADLYTYRSLAGFALAAGLLALLLWYRQPHNASQPAEN